MKKTSVFLALAAAATLAGTAHAQVPLPNITPFSVEVRGGASVPTGDLADAFKLGWTAGANVTYHALPLVGVYAGYTLDEWKVDADANGKAQAQNISFGARLGIPTPMIPIDPWIKAGAVSQQVKTSDFDLATLNGTSDREWGFEAGAGLGITLGPKVSFTPGVSFVSVKDAKFIRGDVGLRIRI
ncbi:MAG TPA: outer membrane beta-barrel protein [Longimicrobiaceae bacterium]|nr:outer membrane beta-barrel protein [Longimicrobiaceae bacterium]